MLICLFVKRDSGYNASRPVSRRQSSNTVLFTWLWEILTGIYFGLNRVKFIRRERKKAHWLIRTIYVIHNSQKISGRAFHFWLRAGVVITSGYQQFKDGISMEFEKITVPSVREAFVQAIEDKILSG